VRPMGICFVCAFLANALVVVAAAAVPAGRGLKKPIPAGPATLGADLASVLITVAGLLAGLGLFALALGLAARSALLGAACAVVLSRSPLPRGAGFSWRASKQLWHDAARFFVTSIAMRLMTQANVLAVGMVLGPATAAIYSLSVRAHETVFTLFAQLHGALGPALAHMAGGGQLARLDSVIGRVLPFSAAAAALGAVCVTVLNHSFVSLWVGESAWAGIAVTAFMSLQLWVSAVGSVAYEALLARGEFARIAQGYATAAALHVLLLAMGIHFGMAMAPAALVVSTAVWAAIFWRQLGFSSAQARMLLATLAAATLAALTLYSSVPPAQGWWAFVWTAAFVFAVTAALLLAVSPPLRRVLGEESAATLRLLRARSP
jgi:O-antigen/teichoic acid export membrane protein